MSENYIQKKEKILVAAIMAAMLGYFLLATPVMMDDGFQYEGFAESAARGKIDFKSFYGFQGLSFFAVPVFWLTNSINSWQANSINSWQAGSHSSIIIVSVIFSLLSIPLAYFVGRDFYEKAGLPADSASVATSAKEAASAKAGLYFLILFLLTPYPYTTMMRGFQEAALLFFILLIIYGSLKRKNWTPVAWAVGGVVKPFALILFPLFTKDYLPGLSRLNLDMRFNLKKIGWVFAALLIGALYLGASYYQTGHLVNNAAINSYQGNFDTGNPPPLVESFTFGIKGFLRVGANLLLSFRKIMISPLVIILGAFALLRGQVLSSKVPDPLRKEMILAVALNFLLVGSLTFSFSKYLLPMTTLFALASVGYLLKYRWLMPLVFVDSFFVFLPIWNYFGYNFWSSQFIFYLPMVYALGLLGLSRLSLDSPVGKNV